MMNAFCFVGLDIGRYNIAVCIIDEAENGDRTNYFNSSLSCPPKDIAPLLLDEAILFSHCTRQQ